MDIRSRVQQLDNIYLLDFLMRIMHASRNSEVKEIISTSTLIDSIEEYEKFKDFVIDDIKTSHAYKSKYVQIDEYGSSGLLYGHRDAILQYADVNLGQAKYILPFFEHGVSLENWYLKPQYANHPIYIMQGDMWSESVHKMFPYRLTFCIGPYILYANNYYDDQKMSDIRARNGKTILLFPMHSTEHEKYKYSKQEFAREFVERFRNEFDNIYVSVYWNDVDDELPQAFQDAGAKLVSAGFRGDPQFISRLRTMILLSDVVAGNGFGTHIGYAIALNRPYIHVDVCGGLVDTAVEKMAEDDQINERIVLDECRRAFARLDPTEEERHLQEILYNKLWGGDLYNKDRREIQEMISLASKISKVSRGSINKFEKTVKKILDNNNSDEMLTSREYDLLCKSSH